MKNEAIENIKELIKITYGMSDTHEELAELIYDMINDSYDNGYKIGLDTAKESIEKIIAENFLINKGEQ